MRLTDAFCRCAVGACLFFAFGASTLPSQALQKHAESRHNATPQASAARFVVVIDAAHGGSDPGVRLSPTLNEKTVTMAMASHLRSLLKKRGISVVMTRTKDTDPSLTTRAEIANHARAAACLILHATASGVGVHLFTSSLSPAPKTAVPAWATAQAAYVDQSARLSSDIDAALTQTSIPVIVGRTFLRPLDNLTCPAVAIELAPRRPGGNSGPTSVENPNYQRTVLRAIVAGILQWRQDWSRRP